jgi:hypothetical protein
MTAVPSRCRVFADLPRRLIPLGKGQEMSFGMCRNKSLIDLIVIGLS